MLVVVCIPKQGIIPSCHVHSCDLHFEHLFEPVGDKNLISQEIHF